MKLIISLFTFLCCFSLNETNSIKWQELDEGLYFAELNATIKSEIGNNKISVLKIDPQYYDFNLLTAKEKGVRSMTAKKWTEKFNQIAVINAGMYQADHKTNVGFMRNFSSINNSRLNKNNTIVAFNRKDKSVPEFQIIDRTCQDWEALKDKYHSFSQSIRMVDCNQKNRWGKQPKKWSMVAIGKDKKGNALFAFSRSPYTVHDFIKMLLNSPLDLYNLMYLEGGPEASFYVSHNDIQIANMGSYETGFNENDDNDFFWPIPNVIGISKK